MNKLKENLFVGNSENILWHFHDKEATAIEINFVVAKHKKYSPAFFLFGKTSSISRYPNKFVRALEGKYVFCSQIKIGRLVWS